VVGGRLRQLADRVQVLCITHLPQIAAYGTSHYSISKSVRGGRTVTTVSRISGAERELELARMIAGAEPSASVRQGAREMLAARAAAVVGGGAKANQRRKAKAKAWPESI
jgi:DNA repair protein RecN (Recombination protein N)